jgi:hypothetical protein
MAKAKAKKSVKAAAKSVKAANANAPGVIDTIVAVPQAGGGTVDEIAEKVAKKFPDRAAKGILGTCKVQLSRLGKSREEGGRALKIKRAKSEGERGMVYSL